MGKRVIEDRWDASELIKSIKEQKGVDDDKFDEFLRKIRWAVEVYAYLSHLATDLDPQSIPALQEADRILGVRRLILYEDE